MCGIYGSTNASKFEILDYANRARGNFASGLFCYNDSNFDFQHSFSHDCLHCWYFRVVDDLCDFGSVLRYGNGNPFSNKIPAAVRRRHRQTMKALIAAGLLAVALMFVVTSCNDRTRETCQENPTAVRCNP